MFKMTLSNYMHQLRWSERYMRRLRIRLHLDGYVYNPLSDCWESPTLSTDPVVYDMKRYMQEIPEWVEIGYDVPTSAKRQWKRWRRRYGKD